MSKKSNRPKETCPSCGQQIQLNGSGLIKSHACSANELRQGYSKHCPGSLKKPGEKMVIQFNSPQPF